VDGIHDLGGMEGLGAVEVEDPEPVFHEPWEGRVFGLAAAGVLAGFSTPMFRHAIERMEPGHYLRSSYYERWLTAAATLHVESGVLSSAQLGDVPLALPVRISIDDVAAAPVPGSTPLFSVGDAVEVKDLAFAGHTRCPRYVRRRRGVVVRVDAPAPVPEIEAHRRERVLEHTYCVRFGAAELWGTADANACVHVDLYERYLGPA
jgi:nitrile hydratase subunit beta